MALKLKLPAVLKQKKIVIPIAVLLAVLLIAAIVMVVLGGKNKAPPPADESSSVQSSSEAAPEDAALPGTESAPPEPPKQVTVSGININNIGLCIAIPAGAGITDPNIPPAKVREASPVTTFHNGKRSEVALRFADNTVTRDTMPVIYIQGFELGDTLPEAALYEVTDTANKVNTYSYSELADKVLYSADGKLVIDLTAFSGEHTREAMQTYIESSAGKELRHISNTVLRGEDRLADGSFIYKYDWMPPAFDYITTHIKEIIMPIQYATPYSLESIGYTVELGAAAPISIAAISSATVKANNEGGHSGLYTAKVYGGERLLGDYTVLQPSYPSGDTSFDNPSSFALLQVFKNEELQGPNAGIKFLRRTKLKNSNENYYQTYDDGPFSEFSLPTESLKQYIVYTDEAVTVYDFFDFAKVPELEEQLKKLAETEGFEHYATETESAISVRRIVVESDGGLKRYIKKLV